MRYLIAFILCALGLWSISSSWRQGHDVSGDVKAMEVRAEEDPGGDEADGTGGSEALKELSSLARPQLSDPLSSRIAEFLKGLIGRQLGAADRGRMVEELVRAMARDDLGDPESLRSAAGPAVDLMLREAESARSAGADATEMTPFQVQAVNSIAGQLAGSLRRALKASRDGVVHQGPLLTVQPDFEVPKGYVKATWDVLGGFYYVEGKALPENVRALQGKKVGVTGYMMAMGEFEDIHVFALVESQWSCCFGTPPDVHQVVEVTLDDHEAGVELVPIPVLVLGVLDVGEVREDGWVVSVYRLKADTVEVLE